MEQDCRCIPTPSLYQNKRFSFCLSDCFQDADEIVITGIYSAGEKAIPGVTGKLIADAVESKAIGKNVRYCEHREDLIVFLRELLVEGDLCLTLGAGDLTNIVDQLMGALEDGR